MKRISVTQEENNNQGSKIKLENERKREELLKVRKRVKESSEGKKRNTNKK